MRMATVALCAACGRIDFASFDASQVPAASYVQTITPNYVMGPSLTAMVTVESGNMLIAATYWHVQGNTVAMSDSVALAWTPVLPVDNPSCFTDTRTTGAQLWYAPIETSATISVTVTQSDTTNAPLGMRLLEYAGVAGYHASISTIAPNASNAMTAGPLRTSVPSVSVALFVDTLRDGVMTPGTGWNLRAIEMPFYTLVEDNVPGAQAGMIEPTAALPSGTVDACWVGAAVAFETL